MKRESVTTSLMIKCVERFSVYGIQFMVGIILARLLSPSDYGVLTLMTAFITIANIFIQNGFSTALIQKKHIDDTDLSSVFFITMALAVLIYVALFFTAPYIATYYKIPILCKSLRVMSLMIFFGGLNSIQNAVLSREFRFKLQLYSNIGACMISGTVGIVLAYRGFGIWALVAQQVLSQVTNCVIMWFTVKWRPNTKISLERSNGLFSFGWKVLVSGLIDSVYMEIRSIIIAKKYASASLGFYDRGKQFPQAVMSSIQGAIQAVMLPALASEQDNLTRSKKLMRKSMSMSAFLVFPMVAGLAAVSENLVVLLLTDKWLEAAPFIKLFCVSYGILPISTTNLQAINAMGRSDIYLKLEIVKKVIGIPVLLVSVFWFNSVFAIAAFSTGMSVIGAAINAFPSKSVLNYSYLEQLQDIVPSLMVSLVMFGIVSLVGCCNSSVIVSLAAQIVIGVTLYITLSYLFKLGQLSDLVAILRKVLYKR